jgi:hypothetical protein
MDRGHHIFRTKEGGSTKENIKTEKRRPDAASVGAHDDGAEGEERPQTSSFSGPLKSFPTKGSLRVISMNTRSTAVGLDLVHVWVVLDRSHDS